ncbi:hypothetical protein SAMN05216327_109203 [Dyadobacter sp. SG02]|uniref:glycosyltransferase family 2 protein n=1 Tax=Dyadobacter sp. SG02 TaxID=1855291 RepID=UPI0008AE11BD|nr:glycosyltransferase family 2 protein [Dyadobacter sp. SG02]SEJ39112.1 hypothetical protein SAMN05216327_109203 [Dyadobacter sp. SG02]
MTVSVCIPTYNQSAYIAQAVGSVMSQSLLPDEIIVCDDCSTDGTPEILARLATEICILRVIRQTVNTGIVRNTDHCLRAAKGDHIVRLDSDDMLLPDYIAQLSALLTANPQAGYAHAAVQEIDQAGNAGTRRSLFRASGFQTGDDALKAALKGYRVAANILIFKKEVLEKVGYMNSRENFGEDYHLAVRIAAAGYGNVYCDKVLSAYRVWTDPGRVRNRRKLAEINGLYAVFSQALTCAFEQRGWDTGAIARARERFAVRHSECLSWAIYSEEEKAILEHSILELSPTPITKCFIWLHKNGFGPVIRSYRDIRTAMKLQLKNWIPVTRHAL